VIWAAVLCSAIVAMGVAAQIHGHRRDRRRLVLIAKPVASLAFVLLGLARWTPGESVETWLLAALVLCLAGDVLLLWPRSFDAGLAAFLLGHLVYARAFHVARPLQSWPPLLLLPLAVVGIAVAIWLWPRLEGHRRLTVPLYIAAIAVMVWGGLAAARAGAVPAIAGIGAVLFFLSDITVARERFVHPSWRNRAVGLPMYYAGQVLLALTIAG
jgi:uncharacterized membrane protein YhhN